MGILPSVICHRHSVDTTGLWTNNQCLELACSPDGVVTDGEGNRLGLVEIKCLFLLKDSANIDDFDSVLSKQQQSTFCLEKGLWLRGNHMHYFQVAGVCSTFVKVPYETQLEIKHCALEKALRKVVNIVKNSRVGAFTSDMERMAEQNQGCICPLLGMLPSPKPEGYRNKEEMNIALGADGDQNTVGLIIGRGENCLCVPNHQLCNTKLLHNDIVKTFKAFLDKSKFKRSGSERTDFTDHWKKVLIRSSEQGHVMLVPDLCCREITQDLIDEAAEELRSFYSSGSHMLHGVHSLFLRLRYPRSKSHRYQHHVCGGSHIYEEVLGYKFRISPEAFFQLNTPGAEVLYSVVQDLVKNSNAETVLDVGCGTGTISVVTSSLADQVIGLDVVKQAIDDAEFNAHLNGVRNASFHVGSARAVLKSFIADGSGLNGETVAIVNPNRNGLNKKAILRLRCCESIKHLIFISCKPYGNAVVNFVDLIVPEKEDHPGKPFKAVQAVGVDMFPQTIHSELVMLFQR